MSLTGAPGTMSVGLGSSIRDVLRLLTIADSSHDGVGLCAFDLWAVEDNILLYIGVVRIGACV
jgi:hypothetical protein